MQEYFQPGDMILSCQYIERGLSFQTEGVVCCNMSNRMSPPLVTVEEINSDDVITYELIVQRRKELFYGVNGKGTTNPGRCKDCPYLYRAQFKDISFTFFGNVLCTNIQYYSQCNLRCSYCGFTQANHFIPPAYSYKKIIHIIELFRKKGKLQHIAAAFSGGEPTLLKEFNLFLDYWISNHIGDLCVFSNAVKYSDTICKKLAEHSICLTTSIDAGIPSTFMKMRGADVMYSVVDTLIRYRKSKTKHLFLKYIATPDNINDDDLFAFVFLMVALRPSKVYYAIDFPQTIEGIPHECVLFCAKLSYLLKKYGNISLEFFSVPMENDPVFAKCAHDIRVEFEKLVAKNPLSETYCLIPEPIAPSFSSPLSPVPAAVQAYACCPSPLSLAKHAILCMASSVLEKVHSDIAAMGFLYMMKAFATNWYRTQNLDVVAAKVNPLVHYIRHGAQEGRNPVPWFDTSGYLARNPDVRAAGVNPFYHYLRYGYAEGRTL